MEGTFNMNFEHSIPQPYGPTRLPRWAAPLLTLAAVYVVTVLTVLRFAPGRVQGETFVRALIARSAVLAVVGAGVAVAISLALRAIRVRLPFAIAAVGGAGVGLLCHAVLLASLSPRYDERILRAADAIQSGAGLMTIHSGARELAVRPMADSWVRADPLVNVPDLAVRMLCAAEDERCFDRLVSIDPMAYARAAAATAKAKLFHVPNAQVQGASDTSAQLARLLLGIHASGAGWDAVRAKLEKTLAAWRIDDLLSRRQQLQLYLATAPFGSFSGHEAIGLESSAHVFYGKAAAVLDAAELAELMAHLRNPNLYFPYRKTGESEQRFQARLTMLRVRAEAILDVAERKGWITSTQRDEARGRLFVTLLPPGDAAANMRLPHAASVFDTVTARVPDAAQRHLSVTLKLDEQLQAALAEAIPEAEAAVQPRLSGHQRHGDTLATDVVVIHEDGAVAALAGLASVSGGMASNLKPEFYALWLELNAGRSMGQRLHGLRITAADALTRSYNPGAEEVVRQIGLGRVVAHLRSQGYSVLGPFEPVVLGAGVTGSPWLVAGNFVKFGYSTPGYRVQPSLVARISDVVTGAVLFEPEKERVFSARVAVEVRTSLERVGTVGTARGPLHGLASASAIAAKTGTAGFFRRGRWNGPGGSWCVAADKSTGLIIAVRMRWTSGAPLEVEGGKSAALVVANFLGRARGLQTGGNEQ